MIVPASRPTAEGRILSIQLTGCPRRYLVVDTGGAPYDGEWPAHASSTDVFVLRGELALIPCRTGATSVRLSSGDRATIPAGTAHRVHAGPDVLFELYLPSERGGAAQ